MCLEAIFYLHGFNMVEMNEKESPCKNNWLMIDLDDIWNNLSALRKNLPNRTRIMAVVKDNAYGFGNLEVAGYLEKKGISFFCVANLEESIDLRRHGVLSRILILGYTSPKDIYLVQKYRLIQTLLDGNYAETINSMGVPIEAHIKIDTGMHRNGEIYSNIERIKDMFLMDNLQITGIYSHLSVADSVIKADIDFTHEQVSKFKWTISELERSGFSIREKHILSSYGVLNYPEYAFDFVRVGLSMYGVPFLDEGDLKITYKLQSRVVLIKTISNGDSVGYGRMFVADRVRRIAVVSLGYGTALPRALSNKGRVIVNESYAPIIGSICMDHCLVDITEIEGVQIGSIVTFLGTVKDKTISVEEWARLTNTIPNELLCKIDKNIQRVYSK